MTGASVVPAREESRDAARGERWPAPGNNVNPRLRVALVHYRDDAGAGGSLRVGEALARNLDRSRIEPRLIFAYGGEGAVARGFDGESAFLGASGPVDPGAWMRARSYFRRLDFDVVHFIDPVNWLRAILAGSPAKKIVHVHGRFLPGYLTLKTRLLNRLAVGGADARVCITHGALKSLKALGWTGSGNNFVVHNGIDCEHFAPLRGRTAARAAFGLQEDALVMGMACRLVKYRGVQDALRVLAKLPSRWRLILCGDGPFRADLEALAIALGVRDRVHFTGLLEDVRPAYASMNVFLFLARYDTFGLATAEAMACGVPVLGLEGDGEYQEPEYPLVTAQNASLIPRRNKFDLESEEADEVIDTLAKRLRALESDADAFRPMREKARAWVVSRFDVKRQAGMLADVYESVAAG